MQLKKAKIRYPVKENTPNQSRISLYQEDFKGEYYNLTLDKLIPFKTQARKNFDAETIDALAQTIKEHGIRQPLTVIPSKDSEGKFEVVSGERRLRAAKLLKMATVPCIIIHDNKKAHEIAIIENVQREDLHPIELMQAYQNLLDSEICNSTQEIAKKVGLPKSSVVETLSLKNLAEATQKRLIEQKIKSRDLFRKLLKAEPETHNKLIDKYLSNIEDNRTRRGGLPQKANIISIILKNEKLDLSQNKIHHLNAEQKRTLKSLFLELIKAC